MHFVQEKVAKKKQFVQFVSSREQFADILTKGLSVPLFKIQWSNPVLDFSKQEIEGDVRSIILCNWDLPLVIRLGDLLGNLLTVSNLGIKALLVTSSLRNKD